MSDEIAVRRIGAGHDGTDAVTRGLVDVVLDCVDGGASIGFLWPFDRLRAEAFWSGVLEEAARGERILLVAEEAGVVIGTAQVIPATAENQPHRADVAKVLVHRRARRRGVAEALMRAAEAAALEAGRTRLVLDTASADAERLYDRLGWQRVGVVPGYALWPDGSLVDTVFFTKDLSG